ncbi:unnamed protein product [Euphydryas editha]|uniref:115 kDa protein in type-1 retrotransposable element R1DM n=1 Tax=Euphydryas editha TaxID=104508 RepID=A0AAU9VFP3_EUPED|nr:unnamed protein product [Euphydryas editha]
MVMTRKLKHGTPRLRMGGIDVVLANEIKLLGVVIDRKLTFNSHVANVCRRSIAFYHQLARTAKATWGLHPEVIRIIYKAVVEPVILYAAAVWEPAVHKQGIRKQLNVVQRGFAQKLCRAYPGVTKLFFPDAEEAYGVIGKIKVDRFVTQVLTGHGGFSEYLYRFKCKDSPSCVCDPGCPESVLHTLLECPIYDYERHKLEKQIEIKMTKENLHIIIGNKKTRDPLLQYCKKLAISVNNRNKT